MTKEQYDKAGAILNEFESVKKQLEMLECCTERMKIIKIQSTTQLLELAEDAKDIILGLLKDNSKGKDILIIAVEAMKTDLNQQAARLADEFNKM